MSHSYAVVVICIKIIYYSYDAGFLLFLEHIWMRIVGWIHGWLFKVALLETWWWWVLTYMMIGCFVHMLIDWWYLVHADLDGYGVLHIWYNLNDFVCHIQNSFMEGYDDVQKDELISIYRHTLSQVDTYTGCWSGCCW